MGRLFAVEIVYRGIFQKTLAKHISRAIVLAAHREGKPGISFGRYGDSPERNGIPAKSFAIVAADDITLEEGMAKYEPKEVDISICLDDTLCKGVESWAWYGLQPINKLLKPGGTLIVTSREEPDTADCHEPSQGGCRTSWPSSRPSPASRDYGFSRTTIPTCVSSGPSLAFCRSFSPSTP